MNNASTQFTIFNSNWQKRPEFESMARHKLSSENCFRFPYQTNTTFFLTHRSLLRTILHWRQMTRLWSGRCRCCSCSSCCCCCSSRCCCCRCSRWRFLSGWVVELLNRRGLKEGRTPSELPIDPKPTWNTTSTNHSLLFLQHNYKKKTGKKLTLTTCVAASPPAIRIRLSGEVVESCCCWCRMSSSSLFSPPLSYSKNNVSCLNCSTFAIIAFSDFVYLAETVWSWHSPYWYSSKLMASVSLSLLLFLSSLLLWPKITALESLTGRLAYLPCTSAIIGTSARHFDHNIFKAV